MLPHPFPMRLMSGGANAPLAHAIAKDLEVDLVPADVSTFADGETFVEIKRNVRECTVFIVQPTSPPVNDRLIALALLTDAARRAGAARVVALAPYFGYARQERRMRIGQACSARIVSQLLGSVGLDHLVTLDVHAPALESAFPMSTTLLDADALFLPFVCRWGMPECVVVAPDAGAVKRAQRMAAALDTSVAVVTKQRERPDAAEPQHVLGTVRGRTCLLVDDLVSTARTLAGAAEALMRAGARGVNAVFTHAVMAPGALDRLLAAPIQRFATSDSVAPLHADPRIEVVSTAPVLAETVRQLMSGTSD